MAETKIEARFYSEDEYLELENKSASKHELWFGELVSIADATRKHNSLAAQTALAINRRLDDAPCEAINADQRVRVESGVYVYPDVVVLCEDANFADSKEMNLLTPRVLVEVLSASTASRDRTTKLEFYKRIPEVSDYLIVSQTRVYIEHYRRGNEENKWDNFSYYRRDQIIHLGFRGLEIPANEIYRRVDVPEQMIILEEGD